MACALFPGVAAPRASFAQTDVRGSEKELSLMSLFYLMMMQTHPAMGQNKTQVMLSLSLVTNM